MSISNLLVQNDSNLYALDLTLENDLQVNGDCNIGGTLTVTNIVYENQEQVISTANATSTSTGSLIVAGGASVAKNTFIGGNLTVLGTINGTFTSSTNNSTSTSSGSIVVNGGLGVGDTIYAYNEFLVSTTLSTSTTTGSLVVNGGIGTSNMYTNTETINNILYVKGTNNSNSTQSGALQVSGGASIGVDLYVGGDIYADGAIYGFIDISDTTDATSTSTGALQIGGGLCIAKNVYTGQNINCAGSVVSTADYCQYLYVQGTIAATSTSTGTLQVIGGMGLKGSEYIGGSLCIAPTATSAQLGSNTLLNVGTTITHDDLARTMLSSGAYTNKALVVQGAVSQTANLQEWQNNSGTVLASMSPAGAISCNGISIGSGSFSAVNISCGSITTGTAVINGGASCGSITTGTAVINGGATINNGLTASSPYPAGVSAITAKGTGVAAALTNPLINSYDTQNAFIQNNIQNLSSGNNASCDWIATATSGSNTLGYIDMGINGSGYSQSSWTINGAGDGYIYVDAGHLAIGTDTSAKNLVLFTGGTLAANARLSCIDGSTSTAYINIPMATVSTSATTGALTIGGGLGVVGNLNMNGNLYVNNNITSGGYTNGQLQTTAATNVPAGAGSAILFTSYGVTTIQAIISEVASPSNGGGQFLITATVLGSGSVQSNVQTITSSGSYTVPVVSISGTSIIITINAAPATYTLNTKAIIVGY